MTSSQQNSASIRKPRSRPAPSPRDQQIYLDYQTTGKRQIDLAAQYKLTQTRISQIIRRVESWLTSTWDLGPGTLDSVGACGSPQASDGYRLPQPNHSSTAPNDAARDRLQHRVQYERLNEAGRLAMQHFREPQKIVTHKKGARAGKKFHETTERLLPPNLQCLKIVVQSSAQLTRLQASGGRRVGQACAASAGPPPSSARSESCDHASHSAIRTLGYPLGAALAPLSREQVEAWLTEFNRQAALANKVPYHFENQNLIHDVVDLLAGESKSHVALHVLARDAGQKVVKRKPYDDQPPRVPPVNGWFYAMHDADGGLVAWLHASQLADAISPDYPPVSRSPDDPATSITTSSSTSPDSDDSPQPSSSPALTDISPPAQFPTPYEPQPFDLQSIQPTFYQKGCSN
jgi:hypothetical protein